MFHKSLFQCIKSNSNDDQSIVEHQQQHALDAMVDFASSNMSTSTKASSNCSATNVTVEAKTKLVEKLSKIRKLKQKIDNSLSLNSNREPKKKKLMKRCAVAKKTFVLSSTLNDAKASGTLFNATIISSISKAPLPSSRDLYSDDSDLSSDDSDMSLNDESFQNTSSSQQFVDVSSFMRRRRRRRHGHYTAEDVHNSSLSSVSSGDEDYDYERSTYESYLFHTIERQRRSAQVSAGKSRFNPLISSSRFNILEKTVQSQINNPSPSAANRSRSIQRFQSSGRRRNVEFVPNNTSSRKSLLIADRDTTAGDRTCYNTLIGYECLECQSQLETASLRRRSTASERQLSCAYPDDLRTLYGNSSSSYLRDFEDVNVCSSTLISNGVSQNSLKAPATSYSSPSFLSNSRSFSHSCSSSSTLSSANNSSVLSSTTILQSQVTRRMTNNSYYSTANASMLSAL